MWGCCLAAKDQAQFLGALRRLARPYRGAHRLHLILDNGVAHIAHATRACGANHPCWRVFSTPPHASWLHQAELLRRAVSDTYLKRFDPQARQQLVDHLEAGWLESNSR
jgi:hypothetical protein